MRISKLAKSILQYLPVLAALVATAVGLLVGKDLYPSSLPSAATAPSQVWAEPGSLQSLSFAPGRCISPLIYTSLPPKCRTADGTFIPMPGSSYLLLLPERK